MTATYDGRLSANAKSKTVGACCRAMDEAAMRGQFYVSQKGTLMLRRSDKPNGGTPCVCCPFCGAWERVAAQEAISIPATKGTDTSNGPADADGPKEGSE